MKSIVMLIFAAVFSQVSFATGDYYVKHKIGCRLTGSITDFNEENPETKTFPNVLMMKMTSTSVRDGRNIYSWWN